MNPETLVLLKALLKSTSGLNTLKYSKDKSRRNTIIGNYVGYSVLYIVLAGYCLLQTIGYGRLEMTDMIPAVCMLILTIVSFIFTFLKSNGYLFGFKEFDMLVSMPVRVKSIVASRFLYMYIKSFPGIGCASLAMMTGYGFYAKPEPYVYLFWILLTFAVPLIPMLLASLLSALIVRIGSGFKLRNAVQAVLIFVVMFLAFAVQFFAKTTSDESVIDDMLIKMADSIRNVEGYYLPMKWFDQAIVSGSLIHFLIFLGFSVLLFGGYLLVMVRSYQKINSRLLIYQKSKKGLPLSFKQKSVANTIAFKEFKRMLGSVTYITNAGFGHVFITITSVIVLFVDGESVVKVILKGAPVSTEMLLPTVPFIVFFFIGMVSTCCCTPSLEGKNYWIMQSLPITKKQMVQGKMLFNLYLNVPVAVLGVLCFGVCFHADMLYFLVYLIAVLALVAFSTTFGMLCGMKYIKLHWENEIEVIKQGSAVSLYLLPNMFASILLLVLTAALSTVFNGKVILLVISFIYAAIAWICYKKVIGTRYQK